MNKLNELIDRVAGKFLRQGEVGDTEQYHQHEFNGVKCLKAVFGSEKKKFVARFMFLGDEVEDAVPGELTWYDSREKNPDRLPEYRLRYTGNFIQKYAKAGDTLIIALLKDAAAKQVGVEVLVIVCASESGVRGAMCRLFGLNPETMEAGFDVCDENDMGRIEVGFVAHDILSQIGIDTWVSDGDLLNIMRKRFNDDFPSTEVFSAFAQETCPLPGGASPDAVLVAWMNHELFLFKTLERYLVEKRLDKGFKGENMMEDFIDYSLHVHNRRKARAGRALENHFEALLKKHGNIRYERTRMTEGRSRPDFLFPGKREYEDTSFPLALLTMLAAKTTAKDRWTQILAEASRIRNRHLLTVDYKITGSQFQRMAGHGVTPVIPEEILRTYPEENQKYIMTVAEFFGLVERRQRDAS